MGVKVEGIYKGMKKVGQELLCNSIDLPEKYREQLFHAVPEDFDLECFFSHLNYTKQNKLEGFTFINIKPVTFIQFHKDILEEIDRKVVIELREDWMTTAQLEKLIAIRSSYPFLLSVDDFGVGASNLDRIKALHPNFLKIDMKLVRDNVKDLFQLVLFLKGYTKAVLIAEKVETKEDFRAVRSTGIELWSGWYEKELFRSR